MILIQLLKNLFVFKIVLNLIYMYLKVYLRWTLTYYYNYLKLFINCYDFTMNYFLIRLFSMLVKKTEYFNIIELK